MEALEEPDDEELARWFAEFLKAADEGRDIAAELLARAGELRAPLEAKIRLERRMRALASRDTSARSPDAPRSFGRFQILGTLAKTGLSRVYLAHDPKLNRRIALKVLDREQLLEKGQEAWILNEARSLAQLDHPGVVKVYEVGATDTHAYVAMELLTGPSLQAVIGAWARQRDGAVTPGAVTDAGEPAAGDGARLEAARLQPYSARIECLARLAEALAYCHDHGILHRDVKPANVIFDAEGNPKLIDFNLAHLEGVEEDTKLGLTQQLVGTAGYIAPEQAESDRTGADPRSDQFSFGTLAYECFALRNPFLRKARSATLDAIVRTEPPPLSSVVPSLPPDLPRVIHHALARDPAARYPGMAALAADLRAILADRPVSVEDPSLAHLSRLWLRRHRRGVWVASTVLALALGTWVVAWAATTLGESNRLRSDLATIRPAEFEEPDELDASFVPLQELQRRAREFDASRFKRLLGGEFTGEVAQVVQAWSLRLSEMHARDRERSEASGSVLQDMIYRRLMWEDESLCPTCPYNAEGRLRGRVVFPEEELAGRERSLATLTRLDRLIRNDTGGPLLFGAFYLSTFQEVPLLDVLVAGTYRLQVWEPGSTELLHETVFFVPEGWPVGQRLELHGRSEELLSRCVPVAETIHPLGGSGGKLRVPSFRVLDAPITTAEFQRFLDRTGRTTSEFLSRRAPGDPAAVSYALASSYATSVGGRLPTYAELMIAFEERAIALPESSDLSQGEFVLDLGAPFGSLDGGSLSYENLLLGDVRGRDRLSAPDAGILAGVVEDVIKDALSGTVGKPAPHCGFRVVYSSGDPRLYAELARDPIEK